MTSKTTIATHDAGRCPAPRRLTKGQGEAQLVHCADCRQAQKVGRSGEVIWCREWHQYRAASLERSCKFFHDA